MIEIARASARRPRRTDRAPDSRRARRLRGAHVRDGRGARRRGRRRGRGARAHGGRPRAPRRGGGRARGAPHRKPRAMTVAAGSLEYAQARLSARYGERPDELAWRRIEHVRATARRCSTSRAPRRSRAGWAASARTARRTRSNACCAATGASSSPRSPRGCRRTGSAAVGWCADARRPAGARSISRAAASCCRGCATIRSTATSPSASPRASAPRPQAARSRRSPRRGAIPTASAACGSPNGGDGFRDRRRATTRSSHEVGRALVAHLAAFRDRAVRDGWPLRRTLQARLALLFRRAMLDPAAAFIFLALAALDLERLRGEILRRVAFPGLPLAP